MSQSIIDGLFTKVFKLVDELINSFLSLLALGHFGTETLLSQAAWLTESLS